MKDYPSLPMQIEYRPVTKEEACMMCHLSSECTGCCIKCDHPNGCYGQNCSQPFRESQGQRLATWIHLVKTTLPELRKYVPKKYLK